MISPSPESVHPTLPSLMQLVLYCDAEGVKSYLKKLSAMSNKTKEEEFKKLIEEKIIRLRADGNRTILHVAVMNAFARTNANQGDVEPTNDSSGQSLLTLQEALDMTEADAHREKMDRQWKNMIAGAVSDSAKQLAKEAAATAATSTEKRTKESSKQKDVVEPMEVDDLTSGKAVSDLKIRQKNSIEILKLFAENEIIQRSLPELIHIRDIHGHTPFISAIQNRAYGAAAVIWCAMLKLYNKLSGFLYINLLLLLNIYIFQLMILHHMFIIKQLIPMILHYLFYVIMILAHLHGQEMNILIKIYLNVKLVGLPVHFVVVQNVQIHVIVIMIVNLNVHHQLHIVIVGKNVHVRPLLLVMIHSVNIFFVN